MLFLKEHQKKLLKQNSQVGEINKIISKNIQKIGNFYAIFERTSKKVIKTKFPGWGFYFPGTAFHDKSNGTNPPSVSFLCVEKLTK